MASTPNPYIRIFKLPGAAAFSLSAALTRLPMSVIGLSMVLALNSIYNNWTTAGTMSAVYVMSCAVVTPIYARLFDRYGQKKVGRIAIIAQFVALAVFAIAAFSRVPLALLFALAVLVGITQFSVGALVRTRWAWTVSDSGLSSAENETLLNTAYAFESAVDESIFVIGPIVAAALSTGINPVAPFVLCMIACGLGGVVFFNLPSASHSVLGSIEVVSVENGATENSTEKIDMATSSLDNSPLQTSRSNKATALAYPGIANLCLVFIFFNMSFSGFDVAMTSLTKALGMQSVLGIILALIAVGSMIGALIYGSIKVTGNPWIRLFIFIAVVTSGFAIIAHSGNNFIFIGIIEVIAGFTVAPTFATGNLMVKETVPAHSLTEGLSWLSTAGTMGASLGSAVVGIIIDAYGPHGGLDALCIFTAITLPLIIIGYIRSRMLSRK